MQCKTVSRWLAAVLASTSLLCAMPVAAMAQTYRITTHATGDSGFFQLYNLFHPSGPTASAPYDLHISVQFTDPRMGGPFSEDAYFDAFGASMQLELTVDGVRYTATSKDARISVEYNQAGNESSLDELRYTVHYTPAGLNPHAYFASFSQSMWIAPDVPAFSDLLQPVSLSTPMIAEASFNADYFYSIDDFNTILGSGGGKAEQFTYQLAAVPEPMTWAMILQGCAIVAVAARRRRLAAWQHPSPG